MMRPARQTRACTIRRGGSTVIARLVSFGEIEVEGRRFAHDVVIEDGRVRKRKKGPSKAYRDRFGHTPVSTDEAIPWSAARLIIGSGASGELPVMPEVLEEAQRRGVEVVVRPTAAACELLADEADTTFSAILHVTC
jgi:hypothetical protein